MSQSKKFIVVLIVTLVVPYLNLDAQTMDTDKADKSDQRSGPHSVWQTLFSGTLLPIDADNRTWYINPVFDMFQFNTIEGFVFNPRVSLTQQLEEGKFYAIKPNLRYGASSQTVYGKLQALYQYNPSRSGSLVFNGGHFTEQFDDRSTLTPFANSSSTLFFKENYLKLYASSFVELGHSFSPVKDFQLTNHLYWSNRKSLQNLERFDGEDSEYTPNVPSNNEISDTAFDPHQVFYQETEIRWQQHLQYKYVRGKLLPTSSYPAILLKYQSAFPNILGADLSYHRVSLGIEGDLTMGGLGKGRFSLEGGDFLAKDSLSFVDFNHFQGNRTTYTIYEPGTFQLLDYYTESTAEFYIRGHYHHQFALIREFIKPVAEANYLNTSNSHYLELGAGIEMASRPLRVSFHSSWLGGRHDRAEIRFGFVFSDM
ncbi:MAG: DUF5686 family protein [Bacteroidota bacterium]